LTNQSIEMRMMYEDVDVNESLRQIVNASFVDNSTVIEVS
jgi:hypothetical protein